MQLKQNLRFPLKNPVYGRHWISWPMRIVGQIQFWEVTQFAFKKKKKKGFILKGRKIFFYCFVFFGGRIIFFLREEDKWEAWNWSWDLRDNERPQKQWETALVHWDLLCSPSPSPSPSVPYNDIFCNFELQECFND